MVSETGNITVWTRIRVMWTCLLLISLERCLYISSTNKSCTMQSGLCILEYHLKEQLHCIFQVQWKNKKLQWWVGIDLARVLYFDGIYVLQISKSYFNIYYVLICFSFFFCLKLPGLLQANFCAYRNDFRLTPVNIKRDISETSWWETYILR